eukprot:6188228-Pleurochrysis_carterae.AAC.2
MNSNLLSSSDVAGRHGTRVGYLHTPLGSSRACATSIARLRMATQFPDAARCLCLGSLDAALLEHCTLAWHNC